MKVGSKIAIYSCEKIQGFENMYKATIIEQVQNTKSPYKWDFPKIKCQIFTNIELKEAKFDLENSNNKYSFKNISNPEESVFVVGEFSYEEKTAWRGTMQVRDNLNRPLINRTIKITNLAKTKSEVEKPLETELKATKKELVKALKKLETIEDKWKAKYDKQGDKLKEIKKELVNANNNVLAREKEVLQLNEKLNNINISYNKKYKETDARPTQDNMVEFEDI